MMFNSQQPSEKDLPTSTQLLKATVVAIAVAFILIVVVVLPAEYGSDPTGMGKILGLKEMGEIKMSLLDESHKESSQQNTTSSIEIDHTEEVMVNNTINKDVVEITIEPGQAIEIKLEMRSGSLVQYEWKTIKGGLNYNLHGDGYKGSQQFISYKKGRMVPSDSGELKAEFDGYHGWFWRNREKFSVTVNLQTSGDYIQIKQML
ncbi:MAG: transmembrane anchor protein [Candidatus Neomarinimicrobiota bacterium]|uniref:Transmembrane anchor protein n=1 Tax=marine metagenome TaxID=408172 RepID=A0A381NVE8_9ZZZZ|nr:transmembrane anchor protein [Candidatus Neomarinimicrobiota bacterium]